MSKAIEIIKEYDEYYCTCGQIMYALHECPFQLEVHGDIVPCRCCPGCTTKCHDNV